MKAKYLTLFFIVISTLVCNGQSLFNKKYLQDTNYQYINTDSLGNIYLVGPNYNDLLIIITKLDKNGNCIWEKITGHLNAINWVSDFIILKDQKIIILCGWHDGGSFTQSYIMCFDTSGNSVFTKLLGDTVSSGNVPVNIIKDGNGFSATMAMNTGVIRGIELMKFDENGNLINQRFIDSLQTSYALIKKDNGNYILYSSASNGLLEVINVDSNFQYPQSVSSQYPYAYPSTFIVYKVIHITDSDFFAVGCFDKKDAFIGHINKNSKWDWVKKFGFGTYTPQGTLTILDMEMLQDKSWILIGNDGPYSQNGDKDTHPFLIHTDSIFNPIKAIQLRSGVKQPHPQLNSTFGTTFGSNFYFVASHIWYVGSIPQRSPYFELIKTDSAFSGICSTNDTIVTTDFDDSTGIYTTNTYPLNTITTKTDTITFPITNFIPIYGDCSDTTLFTPEFMSLKEEVIYPNPSTGLFYIHFNISEPIEKVEVFNYLGERVFYKEGKIEEIDLNKQASGIYFYSVTMKDGRFFKGKLVKE